MLFSPLISDDMAEWIEDSFFWAVENGLLTQKTHLIGSTHKAFPVDRGEPQAVALGIVQAIQKHLGIEAEQIDVAPINIVPADYRIDYNATGDIAGTWQSEDGVALISFEPGLLRQPVAFLSAMVHEVMHHRLHMTALDMPGGPEAEELSTDLHCITTGFGLIQMQGAEAAGWQGYMRQESRAYAVSLFLAVTQSDLGEAYAQLPARSARLVKRGMKMLLKRDEIVRDIRDAIGGATTVS